jgi:predicted CopG family antitoxin
MVQTIAVNKEIMKILTQIKEGEFSSFIFSLVSKEKL